MEIKKYKLFNTNGKTFFEFRSNPDSKCEGFTLTYCDDGTVVMSGDYGTLCWKRNYNHVDSKDFRYDYGFPNKDTGIGYFEEKICQFGVKQEIREWDKEKVIKLFKERYKENKGDDRYKEILEQIRLLEEFDEVKFYDIVSELDSDLHEYNWKVYTYQFEFMFKVLKSVSNRILNEVKSKD